MHTRTEAGLTQADIAERVGVKQAVVALIESELKKMPTSIQTEPLESGNRQGLTPEKTFDMRCSPSHDAYPEEICILSPDRTIQHHRRSQHRACKLFCVNADGTLIGDRAADYQIR